MLNTKHSKGFFIRLISGITLAIVAIVATLAIMIPSKVKYDEYYATKMAEKAEQERINSLPLELLGITAELATGVKYYSDGTAAPVSADFIVKANFTEKGRNYSKKLSSKDFTMTVPEDFAKNGGTIVFSYSYQPEDTKNDKGETVTPDPVEKTTELKITLAEPDKTVFSIKVEPTYTEKGYAENLLGERKELPALDQYNYVYEKSADGTVATFRHAETGIVIKKNITDNLSIIFSNWSKISVDNVDCHFETNANLNGAKLSYKDGAFVFDNATTKTVAIMKIEVNNITFASGNYTFQEKSKFNQLTIKSKAKVETTKSIEVNGMLVERGGTLGITTNDNAINLKNGGVAKLYGNVTLTDTNAEPKITGITFTGGARVAVCEDSKIKIVNCAYALGNWVDKNQKGFLAIPETAVKKEKAYYVGENCILDASGCKNLLYNIDTMTVNVEYTLITAPTVDATGLAQDPDGKEYVLPKLNYIDYSAYLSGNNISFLHNESKLSFNVKITDKQTAIGDLTVKYTTDEGYFFSVAEGKTVDLSGGINKTPVVLSGKGTLNFNGQIVTSALTVENGATLNVVSNNDRAVNILSEGFAKLFGTVSITYTGEAKGCGLGTDSNTKIYLSATSQVSVSSNFVAIGCWNKKAYLYYPTGATKNGNNIKMGDKALLTCVRGGTYNIEFVAES